MPKINAVLPDKSPISILPIHHYKIYMRDGELRLLFVPLNVMTYCAVMRIYPLGHEQQTVHRLE
jgi:hypothetical protein